MKTTYLPTVVAGLTITASLFPGSLAMAVQPPESAKKHNKPNVLFIVIDDLNDWVGCLGGHPQAQTPPAGSRPYTCWHCLEGSICFLSDRSGRFNS